MTNSRNKGASFEREIGNLLTEDLGLKNNIRRILEQTREKHLPDLMLGRWYIECKRYGSGAEPLEAWWQQVLDATSCLLYTSPSPRDGLLSRMPSSA